jgi:lipocalin-like protein
MIAVCFALIASLLQAGVETPIPQRFVGAWELVSFDNIAADGTRRPGAYNHGQINYDAAGRMSAHLMNATDKANHRYLGYYGPFVVDEANGIVTHIVDGSSNATWVGSRQVRYYQFSPDNLQLTLSVRNAEGRVTGTLVWKRSR